MASDNKSVNPKMSSDLTLFLPDGLPEGDLARIEIADSGNLMNGRSLSQIRTARAEGRDEYVFIAGPSGDRVMLVMNEIKDKPGQYDAMFGGVPSRGAPHKGRCFLLVGPDAKVLLEQRKKGILP